MKKIHILLGLLMIVLFPLNAQNNVEGISFTKIIEVPNTSADELYVKCNEWFVRTFVSAESVIEFSDKENGKILGKYVFKVFPSRIKSTITIDIKDNKIRFKCDTPTVLSVSPDIQNDLVLTEEHTQYRSWKKTLSKINLVWETLAVDLELSLIDENDDW